MKQKLKTLVHVLIINIGLLCFGCSDNSVDGQNENVNIFHMPILSGVTRSYLWNSSLIDSNGSARSINQTLKHTIGDSFTVNSKTLYEVFKIDNDTSYFYYFENERAYYILDTINSQTNRLQFPKNPFVGYEWLDSVMVEATDNSPAIILPYLRNTIVSLLPCTTSYKILDSCWKVETIEIRGEEINPNYSCVSYWRNNIGPVRYYSERYLSYSKNTSTSTLDLDTIIIP